MSTPSEEILEIVDRAAKVGLSPQEWLSLCSCADTIDPARVAAPTPQEWRDAILSTVPGGAE